MFCHFGSFWAIYCPFNPLPPNNPENQNLEEMKKEFGDIIILNLCNKKHDNMMYAYSDIECLNRHNVKKCKKTPGDIILLHMCTIN